MVFNTINADTRRKKITRSGCMEVFFSWQISGVRARFSQLHAHHLADCSVSQPVLSSDQSQPGCAWNFSETQALSEQPWNNHNLPLQLTYCLDKVLDVKVYTAEEILQKHTALSMHTQWKIYRTSLDAFPWYLHMPVLMINSACRLQFLLCHLLFISCP